VYPLQIASKIEISEEQIENEINGLTDYEIGFSKVIEELVKSQKPLIGHNMFLDILFIYQQFIDDLPTTLSEFIVKVRISVFK
jgi:poly(A)-specific ribonuclease